MDPLTISQLGLAAGIACLAAALLARDRHGDLKSEVARLEKRLAWRDKERAALEVETQLRSRIGNLRQQLGITEE